MDCETCSEQEQLRLNAGLPDAGHLFPAAFFILLYGSNVIRRKGMWLRITYGILGSESVFSTTRVKVKVKTYVRKRFFLFFAVFVLISACKQQEKEAEKLVVATAANVHPAMEALSERFTRNTGIRCELIVGSSGKLTAQIKEGAPFDVFLSADMKYPEEIFKSGLAATQPQVYAYGRLVLWSAATDTEPSVSFLTTDEVQHIALANPKTAPYGVAATEVLKYYNIYDSVQHKLVFGESISQTNQFIVSRSAEVGFTAMSVVLSPEMKNKGHWTAPDQVSYSPIEQGIVVIKKNTAKKDGAMKFHNFIFSEEAKAILTNYGYSVSE